MALAPSQWAVKEEDESTTIEDDPHFRHDTRASTRRREFVAKLTEVLLIVIILLQAGLLINRKSQQAECSREQTSILGLPTARNTLRSSGLTNRFWNGDELEPENASWDGINSGHGVISVTADFVAQHQLPASLTHPHEGGKVVYALEAYHMMHCTQILRRDFLLLWAGQAATKPLEHAMHCFDALRQSIMCQANDELLIITGHGHTNGFNQTRQCRSWDALRDYATAHTACYWDDEIPSDRESRWKMCDDGSDGLPVGSLLD